MALSKYERRVLAELEADLGDVGEPYRWRSTLRVLAVIAPLAALAAGLAFAAATAFPPAVAAALTGLIGCIAASVATAMVISKRGWHLPRWRRPANK